jgi:quercetin dioxygenase-like cupin family protein
MIRAAILFAATVLATTPAHSQESKLAQPEILRAGARPASAGPAENFTGTVSVEPVFDARTPGRTSAGRMTFSAGARSAWHSHPKGQWLIVTDGIGLTQVEGQPAQAIRAGDVVWCPPGIKHWHGASPDSAMTHLAIQEADDDGAVVWVNRVSDVDYIAAANQGKTMP